MAFCKIESFQQSVTSTFWLDFNWPQIQIQWKYLKNLMCKFVCKKRKSPLTKQLKNHACFCKTISAFTQFWVQLEIEAIFWRCSHRQTNYNALSDCGENQGVGFRMGTILWTSASGFQYTSLLWKSRNGWAEWNNSSHSYKVKVTSQSKIDRYEYTFDKEI